MNDYEKKMVGLLIGYHRRKQKITRIDFISTDTKQKDICEVCTKQCKWRDHLASLNTLRRIENGDITKKECLYNHFSYKLSLKCHLTSKNVKVIEMLQDQLISIIEQPTQTNSSLQINQLIEAKRIYKGYIYFQDMVEIMYDVTSYILYGTFNGHIIEISEYLFESFNFKMKKIVVYYLIHFYYKNNVPEKFMKYLRLLKAVYPENIELSFLFHKHTLSKRDYIHFIHFYPKENLNMFHLLVIKQAYIDVCIKDRYYESVVKEVNNLIHNFVSFDIINRYSELLYYKKGIALFHLQMYLEAIQVFEKVTWDIMDESCIFYFKSLENLKKEIDININSIENVCVKTIAMYYKMKYSKAFSDAEMEDFIITELIKFLPSNSLEKRIIMEDLLELGSKTHNYKCLHLFMNEKK